VEVVTTWKCGPHTFVYPNEAPCLAFELTPRNTIGSPGGISPAEAMRFGAENYADNRLESFKGGSFAMVPPR
jgi:hypothetical protein